MPQNQQQLELVNHDKLLLANEWLKGGELADIKLIRKQLGNGVCAQDSVVTAIYLAFAFEQQSLQSLVDKCIELKGDSDSIASMACGLWGARNGQENIPEELINSIENAELITSQAKALFSFIDVNYR